MHSPLSNIIYLRRCSETVLKNAGFLPSFMKLFLLVLLVCFMLLLTGELLGNLKHFIFFLFSDHCIVVFLLKVKVILNDGVFYQSLSLQLNHSYEMAIVMWQ